MNKINILLVLVLLSMLVLSACAPGTTSHTEQKKAGFLWGIWHGWIAPVSIIWQIFNPAVRVYEVNNIGWWYDFGFYIAILGGFGGFSLTRRKKRR
jgi:hypothetical protein